MKKTSLFLWLPAVMFMWGCQQMPKSTVGKKLFWNFETTAAGTLPSDWMIAQGGGKIPSATWQVEADSWGKTMALTRSTNTGTTCNLLLATGSSVANLALSAKIRATSGRVSQGVGIIWRVLNEDNYYLACWDPLENTLRLAYVEMGRLTLLRSVYVQADSVNWHTLEIEHFRNNIKVSMDGKFIMEQQDDTLRYPGMIGLWTQADSCAMFDDIRVQEMR
jgi:hypothetical protein